MHFSNLTSPLSYYLVSDISWKKTWKAKDVDVPPLSVKRTVLQVVSTASYQTRLKLPGLKRGADAEVLHPAFYLEWPAGENSTRSHVIEKLLPQCVLWFSVRCNQCPSSTLSTKYGYSIKPRWRQIPNLKLRSVSEWCHVGFITLFICWGLPNDCLLSHYKHDICLNENNVCWIFLSLKSFSPLMYLVL